MIIKEQCVTARKKITLLFFQALFETIIDFAIAALNGMKTHMRAMWTNSYTYTKFHH